MNLELLRAQFRIESDDKITPYLWADESVDQWLNDAVEEAAVRALLIHDVATPAVCQVPVVAGVAVYPLHASIINITRAAFTATGDTQEYELWGTTEYELDRIEPGWRKLEETPRAFIHKDTTIRLSRLPIAGVLDLEVNRLPLEPMVNDTDEPEIAGVHHRHLVLWALHKAFSVPDSETVDPIRAERAEREFTAAFGPRPDADARRRQEYSRPHHNAACWMG